MMAVVVSLLVTLRGSVRSRAAPQLEVLALRHQLHVLERSRARRLRLARPDRLFWVCLTRVWNDWRRALVLVKPETVLAWHCRGFRLFWTWKSRHRTGRPTVPPAVQTLIRTISASNPLARRQACRVRRSRRTLSAVFRRVECKHRRLATSHQYCVVCTDVDQRGGSRILD
jgi:hypothetical protein